MMMLLAFLVLESLLPGGLSQPPLLSAVHDPLLDLIETAEEVAERADEHSRG